MPSFLKTFAKLNLGGKAPRCPLCHSWMEKKWEPNRGFFIFACDTPGSCKIAIRVDDPFVGKWDAALEKVEGGVPCPNEQCQRPMRFFCTSADFMKGYCPKCKATISNAAPDRDRAEPTEAREELLS